MSRGARVASGLAALGMLAPVATQAELWTVDRSLETHVETNDNYQLAPGSKGASSEWAGAALGASRQSENSTARIDANITRYWVQGVPGQNHLEGKLGLSGSVFDQVDAFDGAFSYGQDSTFAPLSSAADVSLGRGLRKTLDGSTGWSRQFDDRLSGRLQLSGSQVRYGGLSDASDYRTASLSASAQYRLNDTDSLTASLGSSDYRTITSGARSLTDQISVGASRVLSERTSVSVSIGSYRTRSTQPFAVLACPLPLPYCQAGIVPFIQVQRQNETDPRGLQYQATSRYQIDETADFSFSASRAQAPSGLGLVSRNDSLSASLSRAFSETLVGSITYSQSRSVIQTAPGAPAPGLQTLSATVAMNLTPETTLDGGYTFNRADGFNSNLVAHANKFFVTLQYRWQQMQVNR